VPQHLHEAVGIAGRGGLGERTARHAADLDVTLGEETPRLQAKPLGGAKRRCDERMLHDQRGGFADHM
jgi:hypothetical protein